MKHESTMTDPTLSSLSDQQLVGKLRDLVAKERRTTIELLHYINELERRRCHLALGYNSAFDFLTQDLGYSAPAAWRRIQSARLIKKLPEVEDKIDSGAVNLTTLAEAQRIFRAEEKRTGKQIETSKQSAAISTIENKSTRSAEQALFGMFPEASSNLEARSETLRVADENHIRVHVTFTEAQIEKLERLRKILSHRNFGASFAEIVEIAVDHLLAKRDPLAKARKLNPPLQTHRETVAGFAAQQRSANSKVRNDKPIHPSTRKSIFSRDQGRCQFRATEGQSVCGSQFQVEIDHIVPRAQGGSNDAANLRLLCRAHNQYVAEVVLGKEVMRPYRKH